MVVISLVDCPVALRGDLTKWLLEINTGVFVGRISARVRDNIWKRIEKYAKSGRATMVYSAANEQGFDFKTLRSEWEPIDFDGIKLLLRPSPSRVKHLAAKRKPGYSKAARYHIARFMAGKRVHNAEEEDACDINIRVACKDNVRDVGKVNIPDIQKDDCYVVFDFETTGLSPKSSEILELAAIRIVHGEIQGTFAALIKTAKPIPPKIEELTGITNAVIAEQGEFLSDALSRFLKFIGKAPLVAHNGRFDMAFLTAACQKLGLDAPDNVLIDTLAMARYAVSGTKHTLAALAEHFGIEVTMTHRGLYDCRLTWQIYEKLINLPFTQK